MVFSQNIFGISLSSLISLLHHSNSLVPKYIYFKRFQNMTLHNIQMVFWWYFFFFKISSFLFPGDHPHHAKCHRTPAFVARPALEQRLALDDVFQVSLSLFSSNVLHIGQFVFQRRGARQPLHWSHLPPCQGQNCCHCPNESLEWTKILLRCLQLLDFSLD